MRLQTLNKRYNAMLLSLNQQLGLATKTLDENMAKLKTRIERSGDLEQREEEMKQLQQIANDMSVKLEESGHRSPGSGPN